MPLDSLSNSIVRIEPRKWLETIRNLMAAKALKKQADADARAADSQVKSLQAALFPALSGAPSAVCGHYLLTAKETAPAEASLTLTNGQKIRWSEVTAVTIGNRRIPREEIASIYGGRNGSPFIEITPA